VKASQEADLVLFLVDRQGTFFPRRHHERVTSEDSLLALRVDRLAALEHRDKGRDLLRTSASVFMLCVRKASAKRFCALSFASIAFACGSASIAA